MEKILLVQLSSMRSIILSLPLVKILRDVYPKAELTYLTAVEYQSLPRENTDLDQVITVDKARFHRLKEEDSLWAGVNSVRPVIKRLRREKIDLIFDLENSWASNLLAYLAKADQRIAVKKRLGSMLYTASVKKAPGEHLVDTYLQALEPLDIIPANHCCQVSLTSSQPCREFIDRLLTKHGFKAADPLIVFSPGAVLGEVWPREKYVELGNWIVKQLAGRLAIVGNYLTDKQVERLTSSIQGRVLDLTDKLTWNELGGFLRRADALVGGSNPCLHLAQAVDTSVLALFGCQDAGEVGPYGGQSLVVKNSEEDIEAISVKAVKNNLTTVLGWGKETKNEV